MAAPVEFRSLSPVPSLSAGLSPLLPWMHSVEQSVLQLQVVVSRRSRGAVVSYRERHRRPNGQDDNF